ncbi:unnamed protein product [Meloidogyne enterolobii]|uniref:Uncharacterized protein n=1 Tax=Meloidogyne enterolobii TaxID=390850 RepID=A0ACB1AWJ1_MELEN
MMNGVFCCAYLIRPVYIFFLNGVLVLCTSIYFCHMMNAFYCATLIFFHMMNGALLLK